MGRNPPQESAELLVRFERDCAIIHGVGFLFCELGACIIQYGFHRRKPTLLSGGGRSAEYGKSPSARDGGYPPRRSRVAEGDALAGVRMCALRGCVP